TRRKSNLTAEEIESFKGASRLYFENEEANKANNAMHKALNLPVARIVSFKEPDIRSWTSKNKETDLQMGLIHVLNLSVGCRVMLRVNISVTHGLANSTMGTVRAIVYSPGSGPPALPECVFVEFNKFEGPFFLSNTRRFPITPISR